jgi:glycine/D-amino acid oxidase-like deaminating enzyme
MSAVVIGGGIIARSIALELISAGLQTSVIYSEEKATNIASLAAGAMLGAYGEMTVDDEEDSASNEMKFRVRCQKMYPNWLASIEDRCGQKIFSAMGTYVLANRFGPLDCINLARIKSVADSMGEECQWVEAQDVPGLHPSTSMMPSRCLFLPGEGSVDTSNLLGAIKSCLVHSPLYKHIDDEVTAIARGRTEGQWRVSTSSGKEFVTECLIVCAGSLSAEIMGEAVYSQARLPPLYFGKGASCMVKSSIRIPHTIRTPNRAFACGIHIVPRAGGHIYIGATNAFGTDHDAAKGIEPGELHTLFDQAIHQINTELRNVKIESMRYGFRPIATTRIPLVGKTRLPGLHIATGTYRNGVLMAPLIAKTVVAEIMGQPVANPFSPAVKGAPKSDKSLEQLIRMGVRDILALLQEPNGALPYDRARELEKLLYTLFQMSLMENDDLHILKQKVLQKLKDVPLSETMNRVFYDLADYGGRSAN